MTNATRCARCRNRRTPGEVHAVARACSGLLTVDQLAEVRLVLEAHGEGEPDALCPACLTFTLAEAV